MVLAVGLTNFPGKISCLLATQDNMDNSFRLIEDSYFRQVE